MTEPPVSWEECSLGDIVDYGSTVKVEPDDIPLDAWVLELEDIEKDSSRVLKRITFAERQSKSTKNKFDKGDVLYGKLRPYLNKTILADQTGYCTTEIVPIKSSSSVDAGYLFYWLKSPIFLNYVNSVSHGLNMPRLGTDAGRKAPFFLPPLAEQRRIVAKLEMLLGKVSSSQQRLSRIPGLLKRFRQSVLAAACSGKLTADWREESPSTESLHNILPKSFPTNQLPDTWVMCLLGDYVDNFDGKRVPVSSKERDKRKGAFPYYGASGVIDSIDSFTHDGEFLLIGEDGANLLSRSTPIAFVASGQIWVNNHAHVLRCRSGLPNQYLSYCINSIDLAPFVTGTAQPKLNKANMNKIHIPVPPLPEQQEIVRRVEKLFAFADRIEARLQQAQSYVDRLTQSILAKAFRGELVPQDPNDEPASELLRRIQVARVEVDMSTNKNRKRDSGKRRARK